MVFRISVLMSVYNKERASFLDLSLQSIVNQTFLPSEIVLIKDGPLTKELDEVIDSYIRNFPLLFKIIPLNKNVGLGEALNIGLKECSFEFVARMDSDDICYPQRFEKQLAIFKEDGSIDLVGSWIDEFIETPDNVLSQRKVPETHSEILSFAKLRSPYNHPTVMFKKSMVESVGGYLPFGTFEDYHLWSRVLMAGYNTYNIQQSLLLFRSSSDMSKRRGGLEKTWKEMLLQKYFLKSGFINRTQFLRNILVRGLFRAAPNVLRSYFYKGKA